MPGRRVLPGRQQASLLETLATRFAAHPQRHPDVAWKVVQARLQKDSKRLASVAAMEETGGEPDVVTLGQPPGALAFVDCSLQSPAGRRSLCYDDQALEARKTAKPKGSAVDRARAMGGQLLTEDEYRLLQTRGEFDTTTSSWIQTPDDVRSRGGALFMDRRFGRVFVYHNGAESYYAARGFRVKLSL